MTFESLERKDKINVRLTNLFNRLGNFQITSSDSNLSRFYIKTKIKDIKKVHNNSLKNKSNYPQLI